MSNKQKEEMRIVGARISDDDKDYLVDMNKQYHNEYKFFTRFLLSLTTGSLVFLVSMQNDISITNYYLIIIYIIALLSLSLCSVFGVLVQYSLLLRYTETYDLVFGEYSIEPSKMNNTEQSAQLYADKALGIPSCKDYEFFFYKCQKWSFIFSIVLLFIFLMISIILPN